MERDYIIAGLRVRMNTFGRTEVQAYPYQTETTGMPDIVIKSNATELRKTQPHLTVDDSEYISTGGCFYRELLRFNGLLLHASAVVKDGYAYLFSAPSGTGKSTHTTLWRKTFGYDEVLMLNDDKPALRFEDGRWYAYGTPWSGKTDQNRNMRVPVGGICLLNRGESNSIEPYTGATTVYELLQQTVRPGYAEVRGQLLELLDSLMTSVPVWRLYCTPTADAAILSHKAMADEAKKRFG